jgi:hypothetical protein
MPLLGSLTVFVPIPLPTHAGRIRGCLTSSWSTIHQEAVMQLSKRAAVVLFSAAVLTGSAITGVTAFGHNDHGDRGHHRGATLFHSTLAPSLITDPPLHGVVRGGVSWALRSGAVRLRHDGRLQVRMRGLLITGGNPTDGTTGPVSTVSASLYCGADSAAAVADTQAVPLSAGGNARIDQRVTLPSKCLAPIVLVHPNGGAGAYIAASGFGR